MTVSIDLTGLFIDQPGVYDGMPDDVYHADPVPAGSLSSSGARKLLPPNCPAKFRWEQDNGQPHNPIFDFGHAAHLHVLGAGAPLVVVDAADWRTKDARAQRDQAYADGHTPILAAEYDQVIGMAKAVLEHPTAAALFNPETGDPEQSAFWIDQPSGIWRRTRFDFLRTRTTGRVVIPDYKTCASADPEHIQRAVHNYGYHQQAAWYLDTVRALGLAEDPAFVFVFQEKQAPYLVNVVQLDPIAERIGRDLNRQAIDIYADCQRTGRWPGYSDDIELISLPAWATRTEEYTR